MEWPSRGASSAADEALALVSPNRRRGHRQKLRNLAYVKVDSNNGGILLDVGESGVAARIVAPLQNGQPVHLRVELPDPRLHFEAEGQVVRSEHAGPTGIELLEMPARSRRLLKDWLFTQLLAEAYRVNGNSTNELFFSHDARPAIALAPRAAKRSPPLRLLWLPVSHAGFARLIDGLALLCAVLLFSVLSLALIGILPSWPVAAAILFAAGGVFALFYAFLFSCWFPTTPGRRLAQLAARGSKPSRRHAP